MDDQYQCRFCKESFNDMLDFLDHFEIHMNQEDQMLKEGKIEKNISKNVPMDEENIKKFQCDLCDKIFRGMKLLQKHVKKVHEKLTRYNCDSCQKKL